MIRTRRPVAGFTLIEAIVAMVITGILAGIVMTFMVKPMQSYFDSVSRAELTDAADVALRRMARDVRLALPNSLQQTGATSFEFIMTKAGGRYRDPVDGSTGGNFLDFTGTLSNPSCPGTPSRCFDVLGTMPTNPAIAVNDYVVVYNLGTGYDPANAYLRDSARCDATPVGPGCNIAKVSGIAGNVLTLDANPFAFQSPPLPSPDARFQVVGQNDKVVRYTCAANVLTRHSGCDFNNTSAGCTAAVLAGSSGTTAACSIDYTSSAMGRNGLLYIQLTLTSGGESVTLFQQINVDNAP